MCGFAGEFVFNGRADADLACAMSDRLIHRGPDEDGRFLSPDGRCAIGFRRLAVIDVEGSSQPMSDPSGKYTVAFNGEIYNFRDLRDELAAAGVSFRTRGDAEVLVALYGTDGATMVRRLDGMFAYALYDADVGQLVLARDRLGQKPLWYAMLPDRVVFASEAKGVLVHPEVSASLRLESLTDYITLGYIPGPRSAWRGVRKLPPGSMMVLSDAHSRPEPYWRPRTFALPGAYEQRVELVRDALRESVRGHMVADVPLGALLSGGKDSAILTALMCKAAGSGENVRTFTAGFPDAEYDEREAARRVAKHLGTQHTELLIEPWPAEMLPALAGMYDEPFADSSALPTWLICKAAREHVTVALAGDGGDEVFGGYDRYRAMHLAETLDGWKRLAVMMAGRVLRPFARKDERHWSHRLVRFAEALGQPYADQYFSHRALLTPRRLSWLFTDEFAEQVRLDEPRRWFVQLYEGCHVEGEANRSQRHDLATYLPDDLLVKTDIASMGCSLELRAPMLDHGLVNLGLSLPVEDRIDRGGGKLILRDAFGDLLPPEVWVRPKRGFGVPLGRWLREDLRGPLQETLLDRSFLSHGIFREDAVRAMVNEHLSKRQDHRHQLWALLILAHWLDRWV